MCGALSQESGDCVAFELGVAGVAVSGGRDGGVGFVVAFAPEEDVDGVRHVEVAFSGVDGLEGWEYCGGSVVLVGCGSSAATVATADEADEEDKELHG